MSNRHSLSIAHATTDRKQHACYGYNYLSSMGALANDPSAPSSASGPKIPDLDLFRESLMDLGDMNLSDSLIQLADGCREKNDRQDKVCN